MSSQIPSHLMQRRSTEKEEAEYEEKEERNQNVQQESDQSHGVQSTSVPRSLTMRGARAATMSVDEKALSIASLVVAVIALMVALYALYRLHGSATAMSGGCVSVGGVAPERASMSGGATVARASDSAFNAVFRT